MKLNLAVTTTIILLLLCKTVFSSQEPKVMNSPDGVLQAQIISVAHDDIEESYSIVKIFRGQYELTEYPLLKNKHGMSRNVLSYQWSPDSRFFVFITKYCGGHSIWDSPTSMYDSKTNVFWDLDPYMGPIVSESVTFKKPDLLELQLLNRTSGASGTPLTKVFSLSKWIRKIAGKSSLASQEE